MTGKPTTDLDRLFEPRSVAVIGASNTPGKMGYRVSQRLVAEFAGELHLVNPREAIIHGRPGCPDLGAVPGPIDLALGLVPAEQLLPIVAALPKGHVRFFWAIAGGFGELSSEGKAREAELLALATERGMRLIGPNSAGMLNCPFGLNASLLPDMPPAGHGLSLVTQSGGLGMALAIYAQDHQLPIAKIVDLGNTIDMEIAEVLAYLRDDPDTRVVGLFLESVRDGKAFARELEALNKVKPVVFTRLGRTRAGQRASLAHLGITPGLAPAAAAAARRWSIPAETSGDLFNIAKALAFQPLPRGKRVAIITGSGGIGSELAELCVEHGLDVPDAPAAMVPLLARHLPSYAGVGNPVDLTPVWWEFPGMYPALIKVLLGSSAFDLVIVGLLDVAPTVEGMIEAMEDLARDPDLQAIGKPVYVFWNALHAYRPKLRVVEAAGFPCFTTALEAVRAVSAVAAHGAAVAPAPRAEADAEPALLAATA